MNSTLFCCLIIWPNPPPHLSCQQKHLTGCHRKERLRDRKGLSHFLCVTTGKRVIKPNETTVKTAGLFQNIHSLVSLHRWRENPSGFTSVAHESLHTIYLTLKSYFTLQHWFVPLSDHSEDCPGCSGGMSPSRCDKNKMAAIRRKCESLVHTCTSHLRQAALYNNSKFYNLY